MVNRFDGFCLNWSNCHPYHKPCNNQISHYQEGCKAKIDKMSVINVRIWLEISNKKGVENLVAKHLSRLSNEVQRQDKESIKEEFLNE